AVGVGFSAGAVAAAATATAFLPHAHILGEVDETTCQITGVRGFQRGIGKTLTSTVGSGEVFQNRQALTVGGLDRTRNNLTLRVCYQTTDTGNLANLQPVTASTRGDHAVNGVLLAHAGLHCCSDFVGGVVPDIDQFGTTFVIRDQTGFVLGLNFDCLIFIAFHDG